MCRVKESMIQNFNRNKCCSFKALEFERFSPLPKYDATLEATEVSNEIYDLSQIDDL